MIRNCLCSFFIVFLFASCEEVYQPKPKGYNRIDLPEAQFQSLPDTFPYQFEYSKYAQLKADDNPNADRYWINLEYPDYDAAIELTYKNLRDGKNKPDVILNEAFELTKKHQVRAYAIEESLIGLPNGQIASVAELEGEVPTPFQFYTSDTSHHFFRGALYFNRADKNDSLSPVIEYLKKDIIHMLNTFRWKY